MTFYEHKSNVDTMMSIFMSVCHVALHEVYLDIFSQVTPVRYIHCGP